MLPWLFGTDLLGTAGYGGGHVEKKDHKSTVTMALAVVIIVSWSIAFLRTQVDSDYQIPVGVTPLMLSVASWCFAGDVVRKIKKSIPDSDEAAEEDAR